MIKLIQCSIITWIKLIQEFYCKLKENLIFLKKEFLNLKIFSGERKMSKAKEAVAELRSKIFENKKQEVVEKAEEVIKKNLEYSVYDVIQDPDTNSRSFIMVKIEYDLKSKKAQLVEVRPFQDKAAGLGIVMDKENRKYLFEKNKRGDKK